MNWKRYGAVLGGVGVLVAMASGLYAQQTPEYRPSILHEYFKPSPISSTRQDGNRPIRTKTREPGGPPALTLKTRNNEPVMKADGPVSDLSMTNPQGQLNPEQASNSLDDETDRVDQLNYFSAFDPSVIPFKRVVAQNKVVIDPSGNYAFVVKSNSFKRVTTQARSKRESEDAFWGTFLVNSQGRNRIPIPSVAANQNVLKVLSEPKVDVIISKDEADNFYVQSNHVGLLRLNVYIAVPKTYFDGEFGDVRWEDFPRRYIPNMPTRAHQRAEEVLTSLGVSRTQSPKDALMKLVKHFRDFEGKPFPKSLRGDDVYKSIALNKIGVCRHRSFAFVMTATALGIPSRYVYNEAHAFVEVYWPKTGWRRVDLGGAAQDVLMRAGDRQQRVHDGGTNDGLPSPPSYQEEIQRLAKQEKTQQDEAKKANASQDGPMSNDPNGDVNASTDPNAKPLPNTDPFAPTNPEVEDKRGFVSLKILLASKAVRRGQAFRVVGSLTGRGQSLDGKPVHVVLVPVGALNGRRDARVSVKATTDARGRFETQLTLPKDLPIGRWTLRAVFDGDESYRPGNSL